MKKAYSALMAVIIMGAVMMIVALTLVTLGGDSAELGVIMADRYYVRNLARTCSEKALRYIRNQEDLDELATYQARKIIAPSDDTMIWSGGPGLSYGTTPALALHSASALLYRFDVAGALPADAEIESAKLRLYSLDNQNEEAEIKVHRILEANSLWREGNNNATETSFFEPNWNWHDYGSLRPWAGSAGMSSAGTDYYALPEAVLSLAAASSTAYEWPLDSGTVEGWLAPENNHGLVLRSDSANWFWFAAKEASPSNKWPALDIIYETENWLSLAGGIEQEQGYCFYESIDQGAGSWLVKTTAISNDLWSLEELSLTKSSSSPGTVQINSWQEVASHN